MISLYRPGRSWLHRLPAGPKLLVVMVLALAISLAPANPWVLASAVVVVAGCYLSAGMGVREIGLQVYRLRWLMLFILAAQIFFLPGLTVAANIVRVVTVILLANLVTLTTRTEAIIDAIERTLTPLRRIGVNPGRVALMLSLTITTIPVIAGFAAQIREAQRARGVPVAPLTFVVPLLIMALKHADDLADALTARGID
ncbi:energy-coupling factor transporter transmembrane protein EcfT [Actinoplanes sp. TBRC 11911]|uniref:energy-coupling factor transporter transmembrane component T family protein n=1 Tax=Actinoplanes sp. TBRC 11911 TaxID=2729386 RepID=UPI00145F0509|nr:energy-coupling factor transporter transmembrane protein EcfT [Actinoplanes sp. TBRC 11911]NMO53894.1 energy-coupling factor transporter transmembrane protein EcfT [Actinoplanes sp. TBRC 11911]